MFEVRRSDKIAVPGMIDSQMINRLLKDDLVIADMSELNANVFYEIGIRHMAELPIIHMYADNTKIPFDVSPHRAIPFSLNRFQDLEIAKRKLKEAIEEVLSPEFIIENPGNEGERNVKSFRDRNSGNENYFGEVRSA